MEEQSFRSERSEQVLEKGKSFSGSRKTSWRTELCLDERGVEGLHLPKLCHQGLSVLYSSGSRVSSTESGCPEPDHTDEVLLSDKL